MKHIKYFESWRGLYNIPDSIDKQYLEDIFLPLTQENIDFNISFATISRGQMIIISLEQADWSGKLYKQISDVVDVLGSATNYLSECGFTLKNLKLYDEGQDRKNYNSISDLEQQNIDGVYCDMELQYYPNTKTLGVYK